MRRNLLYAPLVLILALLLGACQSQTAAVPDEDDEQILAGSEIFSQRCSACHTLSIVGAQGSAFKVNNREYKDGPNFDQRVVTYEQVLYAVRNGGFSSGPMPQNLAVGEEAEAVARFLDKYSGADVGRTPESGVPEGVTGDTPVDEEEERPGDLPERDAPAPQPDTEVPQGGGEAR